MRKEVAAMVYTLFDKDISENDVNRYAPITAPTNFSIFSRIYRGMDLVEYRKILLDTNKN